MSVLRRYIRRQVLYSIILVLAGLLMLFSFFDLIYELRDLGSNDASSHGAHLRGAEHAGTPV
jgi:lipopolysaccharide export system permease protein